MNCMQSFSNTTALRRHLRTHSVTNNSSSVISDNSLEVDSSFAVDSSFSVSSSVIRSNNSSFSSDVDSFTQSINTHEPTKYFMSALKFVMKLCKTSNISRKQIFKILSDTTDVIDFCNNPFEDMKTEYKLLNVLCKMKLYDEPTQFVIEKSLSEVFVKGNPLLKTVSFKGTMLSIKFMLKSIFSLPNICYKVLLTT